VKDVEKENVNVGVHNKKEPKIYRFKYSNDWWFIW